MLRMPSPKRRAGHERVREIQKRRTLSALGSHEPTAVFLSPEPGTHPHIDLVGVSVWVGLALYSSVRTRPMKKTLEELKQERLCLMARRHLAFGRYIEYDSRAREAMHVMSTAENDLVLLELKIQEAHMDMR